MGNYNCRECLDKDITSINELLINNKENSNINNNKEIARNSRTERLKSIQLKKVNKDNNNNKKEMNNDQNSLLNKMKNENNIYQIKYNDLIKEERDNNILLKKELNKINNIKITNSPEQKLNQVDEKETSAHNQNNNLNKNDIGNLKKRSNSEMNSNEQQKLIELQKEQILAQQKIIEQYKKQQLLYEQQQLQLQKAKSKIKEQQNQLQSQKHESPNIRILSHSEFDNKKNVLKSNQSYTKKRTQNKNKPKQQQKISYSKSTPKPFTINKKLLKEKVSSGDGTKQIKEKHNSQDFPDRINKQKKISKRQIKKQEVEQKKEYPKNKQERKISQGYEEQIEENQIEQIENYERIEDEDEEEDVDVILAHQSQKFKIETYEPIEQVSKNDNIDIYDNNANNNIFNNENIYGNTNTILEPKDSLRLYNQNPFIQKKINNVSGKKKKEYWPNENGKNSSIDFNFRGTFEEKRLNNEKIFEKMNIKEAGPRDSQKRKKENENDVIDEQYNINEPQTQQNVYQPQNYPLNTNELKYINNQNINNQEVITNDFIDKQNFFMNNLEKTEISPMNNYFQEQFNQNAYQNNIFITPELSPEKQNDSPKFNELFDSQKSNYFNGQNDNFNNGNINIDNNNNSIQKNKYNANEIENEIQSHRNSVSLGPYLNEVEKLNMYMSSDPVITRNDDIQKKRSYNNIFQQEQLNQNQLFDVNASNRDNPLVYSVDNENMNYLGHLQNSN